jgi:hypothetical protein
MAVLLVMLTACAFFSRGQVAQTPDAGLSATDLRDALRTRGAAVQAEGEGSGGFLSGTLHVLAVKSAKINVLRIRHYPRCRPG